MANGTSCGATGVEVERARGERARRGRCGKETLTCRQKAWLVVAGGWPRGGSRAGRYSRKSRTRGQSGAKIRADGNISRPCSPVGFSRSRTCGTRTQPWVISCSPFFFFYFPIPPPPLPRLPFICRPRNLRRESSRRVVSCLETRNTLYRDRTCCFLFPSRFFFDSFLVVSLG